MCQSRPSSPATASLLDELAITIQPSATERIAGEILRSAPELNSVHSPQQDAEIIAIAELLQSRVLHFNRRSADFEEQSQKALQEADRLQKIVDALMARLMRP